MALPAAGAILAAGWPAKKVGAAESTSDTGADLGARVYSIRAYGAKGDGRTLDTAALQAAIDACTADGGGTVLVPSGTFVIGTVELKSNVTLRIAASGKLLGAADGKQYHAVDAIPLRGDSTLGDGNWALLFAVNAQHITIEGPGTIDGQGAQFYSAERGATPPSGLGGNDRPYHVLIYRCQDVSVRNISMLDCAYHSIRIIQSRQIHLDSIYIHNRVNINNDGFHFISAEYVTISNCIVKSQDDACALFGSCKNVTVTNSYFSTRWSVFRFIGGNVENIAVSNCVLAEVDGCPVKMQGGPGSSFENISFSNLIFDRVTGPISISVGGRFSPQLPGEPPRPNLAALPPETRPPTLVRNLSFSNIHGTVTSDAPPLSEATFTGGRENARYPGEKFACMVLNAVNGATIENITFDNVHLTFGGGGSAEDGARRDIPMVSGEYFQLGTLPAYALYARNVHGLTMQNVRFEVRTPDLRPAMIFDHVEDAAIFGMSVQGNAAAESVLRFMNASQVLVTAPRILTQSSTFLRVEGEATHGIIVDGGDLSLASAPVTYAAGASESAVKLRNAV